MQSFCQRDPRWNDLKLGESCLTLGRFGCTTTAIADLSTYFGDNFTPELVAKTVTYTKDGLIIWQSCVFPHFQFSSREYGRNDKQLKNALYDPNQAVILQVNKGSHWVVLVGTLIGRFGYYTIADPWFGDRTSIKRYNDDITGAAYFTRK